MFLTAYNDTIHDASKAQKFLSKICLKNEHRHCPRCNERKHYRLKDGRRRCSRCKYTFHDFSGRWINGGRLTPGQWLLLIRYFVEEFPALKVAEETGLAYNTVLNAYNTFRYAIVAHAPDAEVYFCREKGRVKCCYGGKWSCDTPQCLMDDVPVFGVQEQGEKVRISLVPDISPGALIRQDVKKIRVGGMIYTDPYKGFDSMLYYGYNPGTVMTEDRFPPDFLLSNRAKGFLAWLRQCFPKYHGVSPINFPLYIKETEFRYNHRHADLFQVISRYVCDRMPVVQGHQHGQFLKTNGFNQATEVLHV
jgi:transposase